MEIHNDNLTKSNIFFNSLDNKNITSKNKLIEYKIEQEIKSLPEELGKDLKRGLTKHDLTQELYIPKRIPQNKSYDKNILIEKIKYYEKCISDRKKLTTKLSNANSSFSRVYNYIKEVEGKKGRQQKYFDDVERIYLGKNYNLKVCGIKNDDNIFSYSILMDKTFGTNIKQDAIRLINEIDNKEIRRENKLIIKFNKEIIEQKLKNKVNNRNKALLKRIMTKNDYGIKGMNEDGKGKKIEGFYDKNFRKLKINRNKNKSKKNKFEKRLSFIEISPEDNYINRKLKEKIINVENNLKNIETEFDEDKSNFIKVIYDNDDNNNIHNHFNTQSNYRPISISKNENKDNKNNTNTNIGNKKLNLNNFSNTQLNLRKQINNSPQSINNKLPKIKINKSFEEIKNLNLSSSTTTNCSLLDKDKNKNKINIERLNLNNLTPNANENNNKLILNLVSSSSRKNNTNRKSFFDFPKKKMEKSTKLFDLKKIKNRNKNISNFLSLFLVGNDDKSLVSKKELNTYISRFQKKNVHLFRNFKERKIKFSNLHGFASNFQRVAGRQDFGKLYEKNKYLKKNNYSNLISNFYEFNDQSDDMNIKNMDNRISNIYYELADFILNDHQLNVQKNKI